MKVKLISLLILLLSGISYADSYGTRIVTTINSTSNNVGSNSQPSIHNPGTVYYNGIGNTVNKWIPGSSPSVILDGDTASNIYTSSSTGFLNKAYVNSAGKVVLHAEGDDSGDFDGISVLDSSNNHTRIDKSLGSSTAFNGIGASMAINVNGVIAAVGNVVPSMNDQSVFITTDGSSLTKIVDEASHSGLHSNMTVWGITDHSTAKVLIGGYEDGTSPLDKQLFLHDGSTKTLIDDRDNVCGLSADTNDSGVVLYATTASTSCSDNSSTIDIIKKYDAGTTTTVVDVSGDFESFSAVKISDSEEITIMARKDGTTNDGIYLKSGSDWVTVIEEGDKIGTATVTDLKMGDINDSKQIAFNFQLSNDDSTYTSYILRSESTVSTGGSDELRMGDNNGDLTVNGGTIADDGNYNKVVKSGTNNVTLLNANSHTGGTQIDAGTVTIYGDAALGSGSLILNGGTLDTTTNVTTDNAVAVSSASTISSSNDIVFSGALTGSSNLTVSGSGLIEFTGGASGTGDLLQTAGTIKANSSIAKDVQVSGGTIQGTGTLSSLTTTGGTVAPGNSIGTLLVSGNYTQGSNAALTIEIVSAGNTDKLQITGNASLNGTLNISPGSGDYSTNTYTFLTAGSISGTFASTNVLGSVCGNPTLSYSSTSVSFVLSCNVASEGSSFTSITSYLNDISATGDLLTAINTINGLSGDSYRSAIKSIDFNNTGTTNKINSEINISNFNFISQRIASLSNSLYSNKIKLASVPSDLSNFNLKDLLNKRGQQGRWGTYYSGKKDQNEITNLSVNGYENDYFGLIFGYDSKVDDQIIGISVTFQDGKIINDNNEGASEYKSYSVTPYYKKSIDKRKSITLTSGLTLGEFNSKRYLKFASIDRTASANYDTYGFSIKGSYAIDSETKFLEGSVNDSFGLGYQFSHRDSFSETGANSLNLSVGSSDAHALIAEATRSISWNLNFNGDEYMPYSSLGVEVFNYLDNPDTKQNLTGQSQLTTKSDEDRVITGKIKSGVFIDLDDNLFLDAHAGYDISENASKISAAIKLRKLF